MIKVDKVKKAYIKLKSDLYFSNNIMYKNMIANFEKNNNFESIFEIVMKIYNGDYELLEEYINTINIFALPKKIDIKKSDDKIIYGLNDEQVLQSVNFFIDADIVIFLLDVLITLDIGKVCYEEKLISKEHVFGNVLSDYKLYTLNINNTTFFEPYFYKYSKWRNKAFSKIKELNENHDLILINYDIKQYFYNYQISFNDIKNFLGMTNYKNFYILERIYERYTSLLKKFKKIPHCNGKYPFPIGLYSSRIFSNLVMTNYDKYMKDSIGMGYYGRYVDDMIVVVPIDIEYIKQEKEKIDLDTILESTFKFLEKDKDAYKIPQSSLNLFEYNDSTLIINKDKIDVYVFKKNTKNLMTIIYQNKILMRVSDVGYSIDQEVNEKKIVNDLFRHKNSNYINKISDLKSTSLDKYELSLTLTKLINFYKNIAWENNDEEKVVADLMISFLSNADGIKYYQQWEKMFNLLNIFDIEYVKKFYNITKQYINEKLKMHLDDEEYSSIKSLKTLIRKSLIKYLNYTKEMAIAINNLNYNNKWIKSLMINKNLIDMPLYLLSKKNQTEIDYKINLKKLEYIPYWVSFEDLNLYYSIQSLCNDKLKITFDKLIKIYCKINHINIDSIVVPKDIIPCGKYHEKFVNHIFERDTNDNVLIDILSQKPMPKQGIGESYEKYLERFDKAFIENSDYENYKIGIASLPIFEEDIEECMIKKNGKKDIKYKKIINHILNEAINNKVDHLVFPELSIHYSWLKDIVYFSKRHNIQVTFGLQYIIENKEKYQRVYNTICSLYPFKICGVYNFMYIDLREKKFYPIGETELLDSYNLKYYPNPNRKTKIIKFRNGYFTNMLCFELTSLKQRALLVDSVTNLFVPVFNKDTNYFSSIVDTTARELYCYVSLSNTSVYGDSRITAPFHNIIKDIVKIKGGNNGYLVVGTVNIKELKEKRKINSNKDKIYKPLSAESQNELK